jgi:hypothetical protein
MKGGEKLEKFAGLGFKNIIIVWLLIMVLTVIAKVVLTKHPVKGVSEFVQTV